MWYRLWEVIKSIAFAAWVVLIHLLIATIVVFWAMAMKCMVG